jgi:hypothetical protein
MNIAEMECRVFLFEEDSNKVDLVRLVKFAIKMLFGGLSEHGKVYVCFN